MKIRRFFIYLATLFCFVLNSSAEELSVVKKVWMSKSKDSYTLNIDFDSKASFIPRIHTLPNGLKMFLTFNKEVRLPKVEISNRGIIKGCFFEKIGDSSLMFVMAFKNNVTFIKKNYSQKYIKITFKVPKKHLIVIDAGHGGKDPGATSILGKFFEKDIVLVTAIELRNKLLESGRYDVILTRDSDKFVSFDDRLNIINASNAEFFISLHTDYNPNLSCRGMSLYVLPDQSEDAAAFPKYKDNLKKSKRFSKYLSGYIPQLCKIKKHACRTADLKILKNEIPSVLVELACISNKTDSNLLLSKLFRDKIICAMLYALDRFFKEATDAR